MSIANVAQTGFASSSAYDTHRPPYPSDAVETFLDVLEIKHQHGAKVLDLGAGTGKFTQVLAARPEGYEILAVEPHDGMREELEKKNLKNVTIRKGMAEQMQDVPDQSQQAVVVAQAFHWMSNLDALREIHRVLKPTAVLGLIWNIEDYNAPKEWDIPQAWATTMRDVIWSLDDGHARFRDMQWKKIFDEQGSSNPLAIFSSNPLFGLPVGEQTFDFTRWSSKEDVWKTIQTHSQVANLPPDRLAAVEQIFWNAINSEKTETDDRGRVSVHGKTVLAWASSIPNDTLKSGG